MNVKSKSITDSAHFRNPVMLIITYLDYILVFFSIFLLSFFRSIDGCDHQLFIEAFGSNITLCLQDVEMENEAIVSNGFSG